ncbi:hypothetical protein [Streptomyces sp. G-G2]|uniref:hypothetical protein n=1 Tax=Streptomyces sp. G-G2 TaxID=3046201 RepID=UPI0024BAF6BD|nr:hypothetical protein [Streptomyces sp. G-G2]MDJ0384777.1 hypothetical protein [Streptomyces sp. G-G2]
MQNYGARNDRDADQDLDPRRDPDQDRTEDSELTTEDIARPASGASAPSTLRADEERQVPLYPGEATGQTTADDGAGGTDTDLGSRDDDPLGGRTTGGEDGQGFGQDDGRGMAGGDGQAPTTDEPLLGVQDAEGYRKSWSDIQGRFVDDPQDAVRSADKLVAEVMRTLAETFSSRKQGLEGQWDQGEQVATEELRLALQQYRSFFNRLLNT